MSLSTTLTIERINWRRVGRESFGYCEDQGSYQQVVKRWRWHGLTVWRRVIDREHIPMWAVIDRATLGFTDWQSRLFAQYGHLLTKDSA